MSFSNTLVIWDVIFAAYNEPFDNYNEEEIGKIESHKELFMIKFVAVSLILFVRNQRKGYLVTRDISQVLTRLTKFPPIEDIMPVVQLALQCREFLLSNDERLRPVLPPLNVTHRQKGISLASIKESSHKIIKKIQKSEFVEKLKPKKNQQNIDLAVISITKWKDESHLSENIALRLISQICSNISVQVERKRLDSNKIHLCVNLLKELRGVLSKGV